MVRRGDGMEGSRGELSPVSRGEDVGPVSGGTLSTEGCGLVRAGDSVGTAYLIGPTLAVTCGHVVQHLVDELDEDGTVRSVVPDASVVVTGGGASFSATIVKLDPIVDTALLELEAPPPGARIWALADPSDGPCALHLAEGELPAGGTILDPSTKNRYGAPRMTIRAQKLAEAMVRPHQPHSGAPVVLGGRVVGHLVAAVRNPNDADECFAGLVEALPAPTVRAFVGDRLPPSEPEPPSRGSAGFGSRDSRGLAGDPAPPAAGPDLTAPALKDEQKYHAFVSYRALEQGRQFKGDGVWTHGLIDRLGTLGYRAYPAAHVLYGDPQTGADRSALKKSSTGVLVFSSRWLEHPPFEAHVERLLKRAKKSDDFRLLIVRLDDAELPDGWEDLGVVVDASRGHLKVDNQRLPDSSTVRRIARAIRGDLTPVTPGRDFRGEEPPPSPGRGDEGEGGGSRGGGSDEGSRGGGSDEGSRGGDLSSHILRQLARKSPKRRGRTDLEGAEDPVTSTVNAADQVLLEMVEAGKRQPRRVRALATRWLEFGLPGSDVPVEAARLLIGAGWHEAALDILDRAVERMKETDKENPRDRARIQRMRGAALGEAERFDEAIEVLEQLGDAGLLDQWSGGILASTYKKKWVRLGKRRRALLRKAFDVYRDTYARTLHFYPGINAATLALLLGRKKESKRIAEAIRKHLTQNDEIYYWDEASLGEAYLLLGEYAKAREAYAHAAVMVMNDRKDMASMRRQIPLILGEEARPGEKAEVTKTREVLIGERGLFQSGSVAAFVGHGLDLVDPGAGGRPLVEHRERWIRREIGAALAEHDVAVGYCSAAAGSDILFAEGVLARSGEVRLYLPFDRAAFRQTVPEGSWRHRFDRLLDHERVSVVELSDEAPEPAALDDARTHCAVHLVDEAIEHADDIDQRPVVVAVWDGHEGPRAEAVVVQVARDEELKLSVIPMGTGPGSVATAQPESDPPIAQSRTASGGAGGATERDGGGGGGGGAVKPPGTGGDTRGVRPAGADPIDRLPSSGDYTKRHLMVVGIDKYHSWPWLKNARNDALGIKKVLTEQYGFELSGELYDRSASRDAFEEAFQSGLAKGQQGGDGTDDARWGLSGPVGPDDLVVLFFAGHGHTEAKPHSDEEVGFLVPVEAPLEGKAGMLRISALREWTEDLEARHVLYIFDSCFSGVATTGGGGGGKKGFARRVITAGAPDQLVADGGEDFPGHSVFTGRLLKGLSPGPDIDPEERLRTPLFAKDLASYLERYVPIDAAKTGVRPVQTPSEGVLPGHGGATIILSRPDEPSS